MIGARAQKSLCLGIVKIEESSMPCVPKALWKLEFEGWVRSIKGRSLSAVIRSSVPLVELWEPFNILAHPCDTVRCALLYKFL